MGLARTAAEPAALAVGDPAEPAPRRTGRKRKAVDRLDCARKPPRPYTRQAVTCGACEAPTGAGDASLTKPSAVDGDKAAEGGEAKMQPESRLDGGSQDPEQPRAARQCRFCAAHGEKTAFSRSHGASCWYAKHCSCFACGKVHQHNRVVAEYRQRRRTVAAALELKAAAGP